jgi:hypothetical protein
MEPHISVLETTDVEKVNMLMASNEWCQPRLIRKPDGSDVYSLIRKKVKK